MSNNSLQSKPSEIRLRRTGARHTGTTTPPLTPRIVRRRQSVGKKIYGGVIFLLVIVGFILQFQWMDRMKENGPTDTVSPAFAEKLTQWMMLKKGLDPNMLSTDANQAEKVACENCMGGGTILRSQGNREICPICQGVGFRMIRRFDPADRICPFCAGMGRALNPDTHEVETCPRCDGRGLILSHIAPSEDTPNAE